MKTRELLALAVPALLIGTLAACGGDPAGPGGRSTPDGAGSTAPSTAAPGTAAPSTQAPITAAPSTSQAADGRTVSITDAQGRTVQVPVEPGVVVATDWSVIRTLSDLGIQVDAVPTPNSALPEDLAVYEGDGVPKVGDVFEPDYEAIEAMHPDLVIVGSRSGNPEVVAEFEKFSPAVLDLSTRAETPEQLIPATEERVLQLGQIFGKEAEAEQLMADLNGEVDALRTEIEPAGEQALFVQVSDGAVSAYGPGSRFGLVYGVFGYEPTDAPVDSEGSHGQEISQEFFVQYDPDVLFVLDRAKAIGEQQSPALDVLNNGLVGTTSAAKDGRIVEVDGFAWYLATNAPSSLQQIVDDVRASR